MLIDYHQWVVEHTPSFGLHTGYTGKKSNATAYKLFSLLLFINCFIRRILLMQNKNKNEKKTNKRRKIYDKREILLLF